MTIYYVNSFATAGTQDGLSKENAFLSLAAALLAATAAGDEIRCHHDNITLLAADTTFTIGSPALSIVSWNFATDKPAAGYLIGHSSANRSITFAYASATGDRSLRVFGLVLLVTGSTADNINLFISHSGVSVLWQKCEFSLSGAAVSHRIRIGGSGELHGSQTFINCFFPRAKSAQKITLGDHKAHFFNCRFWNPADSISDAVFDYIEQGPDTILEACELFGFFNNLLAGSISGTREVRMQGGRIITIDDTITWPFAVLDASEIGRWSCIRSFRDVAVWDNFSDQAALFSGVLGGGIRWHWYEPENPTTPGLPYLNELYIETPTLATDVPSMYRPAITIKILKDADTLPSFYRLYFVGNAANMVSLQASGVFAHFGPAGGKLVRRHTAFQADLYMATGTEFQLVEEPIPDTLIDDWATYIGAPTVMYVDIPRNTIYDGGYTSEADNLDSYQSWEMLLTLQMPPGFAGYMYPQVFVDGVIETTARVEMINGMLVQTYPEAGAVPYPDPIPGYVAVTYLEGQLVQPDITINEPPTGTPVVWDGTVLRSLLPGESIILQNP